MSYHNRSGKTGAKGSHWQDPIMVDGGPLDDCPRGIVDGITSPYKVYYEDFAEQMADGLLADTGWTVSDIATPTSPTETVLPENRALFLNPGSKADSGIEIQFNAVAIGNADDAAEMRTHNILGEILQTTTLMDGQEIFFQTRIGSVSDDGDANDSKYLIGFFVNDATLLHSTTLGDPIVAAGGGFGFHKGEGGAVTCLSTNAAITAVGTACVPAVSELDIGTDAVVEWHTYAARCRVIDADGGSSTGTGVTDFWYDGVHRLRLSTVPFDATDTHSFTIALQNGPASIADMHVDYILTGITRPGLTWPYTNGVIY